MDYSQQLGKEKISVLLYKFSVPAVIGMLVNASYNIIDRIFIGRGVGSLGIAGITISFPFMILMMAIGMLIGLGTTALISIRLGQQKHEEAELIMTNGMVLLILSSLLLSIVGLVFLNPLLQLFGASEDVLPYASEYMRIILVGAVFMGTSFGMNNFIRAEGNPKTAMLTIIIGAVLNIILDPIFIFTFKLGLSGAALATILAQAVSAIWVLSYFIKGPSLLKIHAKNLKIKLHITKQILAIGSAPFAMQFAASIMNIILNKSLSVYGGDIAISAMGIVNSIGMMILMPIFGINQGAQPIIGYNYGARKFERVKQTLKTGIIVATIVVLIGFIVTRLFPEALIGLFNNKDVELIRIGSQALTVFFVFLPIIGFQIVSAGYFQAVGKPKQAMILSLSRQVLLLIPALLILPRYFGLVGVFLAGPVSDLGSSLLTGFWLYLEMRGLSSKRAEIKQE
ncbi:MAG: MATE family efflux transporter [Firmicutes bacterium HGW-Firmicutes-12]|nr:MAG: MATE family efflux transporter [Firmicutes bacterium HGW-Firmicutes-12]